VNPDWLSLLYALVAMLALIAFHGALVACEFSLVKLRYTLVDTADLAAARRRPRIARLMDDADQVARGLRFGLKFSAAAVGVALMFAWLAVFGHWPGATGSHLEPWLAAFAFLVSICLLYLLGDLVPRGFALSRPMRTLRITSWIALGFTAVSYPFRRVLRGLYQALFRRFGVSVRQDFNLLDIEVQMRAMGEEDQLIPSFLRTIIANTLRLRDLELSDVLLPRNRVVTCNLQRDVQFVLEDARRSGHTRFPLCDGDLDHCIGLVHIKDLFRHTATGAPLDLRQLKRDILRLPESEPLEAALEKLLRQKLHMALVVDDFGSAAGIVTLERLIEELVGAIDDELTSGEQMIKPLPDGRGFRISGLAPVHVVAQTLRVTIINDAVSTFGGLITSELGRIPAPKEHFVLPPGLDVVIDETDGRRILSTTVRILPLDAVSTASVAN
jgi:CBS domain containing-hemolysin-like protein